MPKKPNSSGELQEYIPAGNGDASGEYGDADGNNKHFTNFVNPRTGASGLVKDQTRGSVITNPLTSSSDKDKMPISKCKSFDELENYLVSRYGMTVDSSVKALNLELVKQAFVGMETLFADFPGLAKTINKVSTMNDGIMDCNGEKIRFNPKYFTDTDFLKRECDRLSANRWWPANASIASIGTHETAHALEWLLIEHNPAYTLRNQRIKAWNESREAKSIVSQACKNIKKTNYGKGKVNAELRSGISRYADSNASDAMAEAFADVYTNGENANPLSHEIKKLTEETLKSYSGGNK